VKERAHPKETPVGVISSSSTVREDHTSEMWCLITGQVLNPSSSHSRLEKDASITRWEKGVCQGTHLYSICGPHTGALSSEEIPGVTSFG